MRVSTTWYETVHSNLLCLNPSKTEFILIGFRDQLKKIPDPSISLNIDSASTHTLHSKLCCLQLRCNFRPTPLRRRHIRACQGKCPGRNTSALTVSLAVKSGNK